MSATAKAQIPAIARVFLPRFTLLSLPLIAALAWFGVSVLIAWWPDFDDIGRTPLLATLAAGFGVAQLIILTIGRIGAGRLSLRPAAPWLLALAIGLAGWEIVTAKLDLLPRPFFVAPQAIMDVFIDDWSRLGESLLRSLYLLLPAYAIGSTVGFMTGVAIGWSRSASYWIHPLLRLVGPVPAVAWIPVAFFVFPGSHSASTFLIALASFFPTTILTWSGVASVNAAYYDVARTMGANALFLILRVAVPAALPSVFVGLFMALGAAFSVLVVAEMLGVKAGLGWYMQWAQGWASYANMYAALMVMALMCSSLITLLFRIRDRVLSWQKGLLRW